MVLILVIGFGVVLFSLENGSRILLDCTRTFSKLSSLFFFVWMSFASLFTSFLVSLLFKFLIFFSTFKSLLCLDFLVADTLAGLAILGERCLVKWVFDIGVGLFTTRFSGLDVTDLGVLCLTPMGCFRFPDLMGLTSCPDIISVCSGILDATGLIR